MAMQEADDVRAAMGPHQYGIGVPGGVEVVIHSVRQLLRRHPGANVGFQEWFQHHFPPRLPECDSPGPPPPLPFRSYVLPPHRTRLVPYL